MELGRAYQPYPPNPKIMVGDKIKKSLSPPNYYIYIHNDNE
jgi:hypothetical protein